MTQVMRGKQGLVGGFIVEHGGTWYQHNRITTNQAISTLATLAHSEEVPVRTSKNKAHPFLVYFPSWPSLLDTVIRHPCPFNLVHHP